MSIYLGSILDQVFQMINKDIFIDLTNDVIEIDLEMFSRMGIGFNNLD